MTAERSRSVLLWINRLVWTLLVGAVILLGSIVSLGRFYIPNIESQQQKIVAEFNRRTGLQLSIGHLRGSWQHVSPHFVIDDLRLQNPLDATQTVLRIQHAEIQLGLFRSIANRTIAISRLRGQGVHVELEEATLGHWQLMGFSGPSTLPIERVNDLLAAIFHAELTDSKIDLHFFGGGEAHLAGQTLSLQRARDFRRLNLELSVVADSSRFDSAQRATVSAQRTTVSAQRTTVSAQRTIISAQRATSTAAPLRVVFEMQGDPRRASDFSGRGYAEFRGVDLTPLLPAAKALGLNLEHGRVDGASWIEWRKGGAIEIRGKAEIPQLDLAGLTQSTLDPVRNIKAEFLIRDENGKRQLWLPQLIGTWHDVPLKFPQLSATLDSAQPQHVQIALPELQLVPLRDAALADAHLPSHIRDIVTALEPQGALHNVLVDLPLQRDELDKLHVRALLQGISVRPWEGAPGATNVSGYVDSYLNSGRADLVSENAGIAFPHVYHEPLHFDTVRGQVDWHIEKDRVLVDSGPIAVRSAAGSATAQVSLDLPFAHEPAPLMTLQVGLQNSAAQYRDSFIPYTLQPSLLQWLQRAIGKGDIPIGGFIYRGSLRANDHLNNTVQLFLHVRDAELVYEPAWPPLHDVRAGVWLDDADLVVDVARARIYDRIALRGGTVNLQHDGDVSWLTVDTNAEADNDDILKLLRETPLRKEVGAALDHWHWRGPTQSHVQLGIAVAGTRAQEISVDSRLNGGRLDISDQNIVLDDVRGDLTYRSHPVDNSERGLHADAIKAKWFDKPLLANVATAQDGAITIAAEGRMAMLDLKQWLHQSLFDFASGEAPFKSELRIANGSTTLRIDSDLQGAALDLPAPYAKSAEQSLPLTVAMNLGGEPTLTAALSDWADLHLRWNRIENGSMQLAAGVVRLNQQGKIVLPEGQFIVTGAINSTDLNEWRAALHAHPTAMSSGAIDSDGNVDSENNVDENESRLAVHIRDLQFNTAQIGGQTLRALNVSGRRDSRAWILQARAEQIAGTFTLPDDNALPLRAQINYLHLPAAAPSAAVGDDKSPLGDADPRDVFAIDLHIDHLWRGDEELGWMEAQLRPIENGLRLDNLKGQLRAVAIDARDAKPAQLTWTRDNTNDHSEFSGRLNVDDVGQVLQRWHYEPVLTSKNGHADVELQWPGRPDQFKFVQADGSVAMRFDDGQFRRASGSTTGALKVVGIFNFANFLRRLQFDFSDIYKEGLSFDDMQGAFTTRQGVFTTDEPMEIKSPSSRFRLAGQIDFNRDQTDMELVATLPVASNLPWVAALTGALPAAAGLYVASKVFENQFDKFSSASYAITGSWSDPQVKLRSVFDDHLPKRNEESKKNESPGATDTPEKTPTKTQAPAAR